MPDGIVDQSVQDCVGQWATAGALQVNIAMEAPAG